MTNTRVTRVDGRSGLKSFTDVPWSIYENDPNWIPPLRSHVRALLDDRKHPFWNCAERALFIAYRGTKPVGRVAGIIDRNFNEYQKSGAGIWGFFECVNDRDVAQALFEPLEQWACSKGMTYLRGPFNPSTNYEVGILVDGFEHRPTFMMPYNPPYYGTLLESVGLKKEKDLLSYIVDDSCTPPAWMAKLAERLKKEGRFSIRSADKKNLREELNLIKDVYDASWSHNWGFVPMTDEEFAEMGKDLVRIADTDLIFFIYDGNRVVGVAVIVPDITPLFKHLNGKLGLIGVVKALLYRHEVEGMRGLLFGLKQEYRELGLPFFALDHLYTVLRGKPNYHYLELGWNLEDNDPINQLESEAGARIFKRYRVYRKSFPDRW